MTFNEIQELKKSIGSSAYAQISEEIKFWRDNPVVPDTWELQLDGKISIVYTLGLINFKQHNWLCKQLQLAHEFRTK